MWIHYYSGNTIFLWILQENQGPKLKSPLKFRFSVCFYVAYVKTSILNIEENTIFPQPKKLVTTKNK